MAQVVEDRPGTEAPDASVIRSSIETVQGAVVEFDRISACLAALEQAHPKDIACAVSTPAGMKQAIAGRAAWREPRIAVEKARKAAKAPVLALGRSIDGFATALEFKLLAGEEHYDQQIKAEEERRERERLAKIEAEAARVSLIRELISSIASVAVRAVGLPSAEVEAKIRLVVAMEIGAKYGEFLEEAQAVHTDALAKLREIHAAALATEAESARIAAERAELEQLRRADAERRRQAEVAQEAEDALVASIHRNAARIEGDTTAYIQKAITAFESVARDWEADPRPRVADAVVAARKQMTQRLAAAQERERIAAEQKAEAARLATARAELEERQRAARVEQERLDIEATERRRAADQEAADRRAEEDRQARAERAAEAQRIADGQAALRREQETREREEREANRIRVEAEWQRVSEAAIAKLKLHGAAQQMLDALLLWRTVDAAGRPKNTDAYKQAAAAREAAIELATNGPEST